MKIVHAADLHLDSPLRGLERYEGAPVETLRGATRRALENLVDLCLRERAALLLLAGDLYDGDWKDYATGLFFAAQMTRLREGAVRVALVQGNHDADSVITRHLKLPANVHTFSSAAASTLVLDDLGVAVHGQSYATRAVTEDLAIGYPSPHSGLLNLGLLHTSVNGREGHEPYAPTTLETLRTRGYAYWALGHVHTREVLSRDPYVVFPGNLQGRHMREPGAKGAMVIEVQDGAIRSVEHRPLDVARFERVAVDVSESGSAADAVDRVRPALEECLATVAPRLLAARIVLVGSSAAHLRLHEHLDRWTGELRAMANDLGNVWIERLEVRTTGAMDPEALLARDDAIGDLVRSLRELPESDPDLESLRAELLHLRRKLPAELAVAEDGTRFDDASSLRRALADIEALLLPRLLAGTDDR